MHTLLSLSNAREVKQFTWSMILLLVFLSACTVTGMALTPTLAATNTPSASLTPIPDTVMDVDGNEYLVIEVGGKQWLASNLRTTHYQDGDEIPMINEDTAWNATRAGARCDYENDPSLVATYGRLYNYFASIDGRNICPAGWHVSSAADWTLLMDQLGGSKTAAFELMDVGDDHWKTTNPQITNPYGFTVLPAGYRQFGEGFFDLGQGAYFWSGGSLGLTQGWCHEFHAGSDEVLACQGSGYETFGFSIRCVGDE